MEVDKRLLRYILDKCQLTILILSEQTDIKYQYLYQVFYSDRKFKDNELETLRSYLKKNTSLSDTYIDKRIQKIKNRNQKRT